MDEADIVITHGGPATFMGVISKGKRPIVVPRQEKFGEHVNDHQMEFCLKLLVEGYDLVVIDEIDKLNENIKYSKVQQVSSHNSKFTNELSDIIENMFI